MNKKDMFRLGFYLGTMITTVFGWLVATDKVEFIWLYAPMIVTGLAIAGTRGGE